MGRSKKDKVFDLFKTSFKITFFHKPSMINDDVFYYIVLDNCIRLRIKPINDVLVIDSIEAITKSYVSPIFDKIITTIMSQSIVSVLISISGNTFPLIQSCITHNAPTIDDESYVTTSVEYYRRWKSQTNDVSKYGFYILSIGDNEPVNIISSSPKVVKETKKKEEPSSKKYNPMNEVKKVLKRSFNEMKIEDTSKGAIRCSLSQYDTFLLEINDNSIYIKELLQMNESSLNLVRIVALMNTFESLISLIPDIYIMNVMNVEVYRLCTAKNYQVISEQQKIPNNKIFKQTFHGYGSYKIFINN